jgi:serine/threonine-protein kinase
MHTTIFRQIGPYEILQRIGQGGIATVFLAKDTRPEGGLVALKLVPDGPDANSRETAEAEQRGAELQRELLQASAFAPRIYEVGTSSGYLYIAMEHLDGADPSAVIQQGPLDPHRAARIGVELCQFLEEVDLLQTNVASSSPLTLLHNDLKPSNIRLLSDDRVKVLDFGAAKTLTASRRWTRNDFYSTPYLSPECLDSGERDRQTDAWALGVILYEMVAGCRPFTPTTHGGSKIGFVPESRRPGSITAHHRFKPSSRSCWRRTLRTVTPRQERSAKTSSVSCLAPGPSQKVKAGRTERATNRPPAARGWNETTNRRRGRPRDPRQPEQVQRP